MHSSHLRLGVGGLGGFGSLESAPSIVRKPSEGVQVPDLAG